MICKGCQRTMERGTALTWPDGRPRGEFCGDCRDWIGKGHRDSPVIMIGSKVEDTRHRAMIQRTYRNDTTGDLYTLTKTTPFFVALTFKGGDISRVGIPISPTWRERWGEGFSWKAAERAFIKALRKEEL